MQNHTRDPCEFATRFSLPFHESSLVDRARNPSKMRNAESRRPRRVWNRSRVSGTSSSGRASAGGRDGGGEESRERTPTPARDILDTPTRGPAWEPTRAPFGIRGESCVSCESKYKSPIARTGSITVELVLLARRNRTDIFVRTLFRVCLGIPLF